MTIRQLPGTLVRICAEAWRVQRRNRSTTLGWLLGVGAVALALHPLDHRIVAWVVNLHTAAGLRLAGDIGHYAELHLAPLAVLIAYYGAGRCLRRPEWCHAAAAGLLAGVTAGLLADVIKVIVGRPRPSLHIADGFHGWGFEWGLQGFPSGHAAHCFAVLAALAVLAPRSSGWLVPGAVLAALSRLYLERHFPTDLLVGAVLGGVVGVLFGLAARRVLRSESLIAEEDVGGERVPA